MYVEVKVSYDSVNILLQTCRNLFGPVRTSEGKIFLRRYLNVILLTHFNTFTPIYLPTYLCTICILAFIFCTQSDNSKLGEKKGRYFDLDVRDEIRGHRVYPRFEKKKGTIARNLILLKKYTYVVVLKNIRRSIRNVYI